jgi:segregation and condensation protein A
MTGAVAVADRPALDGGAAAGQGETPHLALAAFDGPLAQLLAQARARQIDLAKISLAELLDQLAAALRRAPAARPLGQKADWLVMTAWLLELRSRLLLGDAAPGQPATRAEADRLRHDLISLQQALALAAWLERRPQLGQDGFVRGRPEPLGVLLAPQPELDVIEFLWASLALFDTGVPAVDTAPVYRPAWPRELHSVAAARARILARLEDAPDGVPLEQLLPEPTEEKPRPMLRRRSAWASTLVAGLELAKQGDVVLGQGGTFQPIHVAPAVTATPLQPG